MDIFKLVRNVLKTTTMQSSKILISFRMQSLGLDFSSLGVNVDKS